MITEALLDSWADALASRSARESYARAARRWLSHCGDAGINPAAATSQHADEYVYQLAASGFAEATIRSELAALNNFYRWRHEHIIAGASPFALTARPPRPPARMPRLTRSQARAFLALAADAGPRTLALTSLYLLYGQTSSTTGSITTADLIDLNTDIPQIRLGARAGRRAQLPLIEPLLAAARELVAHAHVGALFPADRSASLGRQAAACELRRINDNAPQPLRSRATRQPLTITPKILNNTFVAIAASLGYPARRVLAVAADGRLDPDDPVAPQIPAHIRDYLYGRPISRETRGSLE